MSFDFFVGNRLLIGDPSVYACVGLYTEERKANPNVHGLLLSVVHCSVCTPAFSIKPEILAAEGTKKVRTHRLQKFLHSHYLLKTIVKTLSSVFRW